MPYGDRTASTYIFAYTHTCMHACAHTDTHTNTYDTDPKTYKKLHSMLYRTVNISQTEYSPLTLDSLYIADDKTESSLCVRNL